MNTTPIDFSTLALLVHQLCHGHCHSRFSDPLFPDPLPPNLPTFPSHSLDETKAILGRKWHDRLLQLSDLCHYLNSSDKALLSSTIDLSQGSAFWKNFFHVTTREALCHIVKAAKSIGLLALKSQGSYLERTCNTYWVNFDMVEAILKWADSEGVVDNEPKVQSKRLGLEEQLSFIETASIRQSYVNKMRKVGEVVPFKGDRRLPPFTDAEVVYGLYESRPQYRKLLLTLQEINTFIPRDEWHRCAPNVSRDKHGNITRIGVRATNPWCSTKTDDDGNPNFHGTLREDLLTKRLGTWVEFDIKASIPSMSLLMTTGMWRDDSEDLYERMAGRHFKDKDERQLYKDLFLPMYFNATPEQAIAHLKRRSSLVNHYYSQEEWMTALNEAACVMGRIKDTVGKLGTEVFLHESCICANAMLRMLKEEGWRVLQVYDGFYIKTDGIEEDAKVKQERAAEIVKEEAERYYQVYHRFEEGK